MSQEMQNFALLKSAAIQASRYWSKFWGYRIKDFSIEGWCWIGGFFALGIYLMIGFISWIENYDPPAAAPQERTQNDILEDILKELKK
jgi:hypothetical protein